MNINISKVIEKVKTSGIKEMKCYIGEHAETQVLLQRTLIALTAIKNNSTLAGNSKTQPYFEEFKKSVLNAMSEDDVYEAAIGYALMGV